MFGIFNAPRNYPAAFQAYSEQFNFYDGRDAWLESIAPIPRKAVHLFCVHWAHLEIHNGGFWQYYHNSTCTSFPEAIQGFEAIGMPQVAQLIIDAARQVGDPFPFDETPRREIVGGPSDRMDFGALDAAFYDLADTEQLFRKKPKFVAFADRYAETM
jgi:hypothetical protein